MSEKNFDHVKKILREVHTGIAPFALTVLKDRHQNYKSVLRKYQSEDKGRGRSARKQKNQSWDERTLADGIDVAGWLKLVDKEWPYFQYKLGESDRAYVTLLRLEGRNPANHENPRNEFSDDEVAHIAQTATYLLQAVGAEEQAVNTNRIAQDYIRLIAECSAERTDMTVPAHAEPQPTTKDTIPQMGAGKIQPDASVQEQVSTISGDMEQNVLDELTEPTKNATKTQDVSATDNVERRDDSRDDEREETSAQVVEREFPRLRELVFEDEDTQENGAIKDSGKRKRPYNKLPQPKRRTSSSLIRRIRARWEININSNNQQITYERGSNDSSSEAQNPNLIILLAVAIFVVIIGLLMPELFQGNLSAWLFLLIIIPVSYMAYKRWLEHKETLLRIETESQRKSLFQRVRGFLGR